MVALDWDELAELDSAVYVHFDEESSASFPPSCDLSPFDSLRPILSAVEKEVAEFYAS